MLAFASDFLPILKPFVKNKINLMNSRVRGLFDLIKEKYISHQKDYQDGQIRDFSDALIYAKEDSLKNEKESAPYLSDANLALALSDLFSGNKYSVYKLLNFITFLKDFNKF